MKSRLYLALSALLIGFSLPQSSTRAGDITKGDFKGALPAEEAQKSAKKNTRKNYPFHGTLQSIDPKGESLILAGKAKSRTILVDQTTKITKLGKAATLRDGLPGEGVSGSITKTDEGFEKAISLNFGNKTEARAKKEKAKPAPPR